MPFSFGVDLYGPLNIALQSDENIAIYLKSPVTVFGRKIDYYTVLNGMFFSVVISFRPRVHSKTVRKRGG